MGCLPSHNLHTVIRDIFADHAALDLQKSGDAAKLLIPLLVRQMIKLINDLLRPRLQRLHLLSHITKLVPNNRLLDKRLPERFALRGPRHRVLETRPRAAQTLEHDPQTLVVEVAHDVSESLALNSDQVLHWHFDVLQDHVGRCGKATGTDFDLACADAFGAGDDEE